MESTICPELDERLYSEILDKALTYLGVPRNYALIGGGSCGNAYSIGDKVYKITTDKSEAVESKKLIGKKNNHIADIYNVKRVNTNLTNKEVYLVVLERLQTKKPIFKEIQTKLMQLFARQLKIHLFDVLYYYRFDRNVYDNHYKERVETLLAPNQRENFYYNSLLKILDELQANGIDSLDVQFHNLGTKSNGNIAFFDLGFGDEKGEVDVIDVNEELTFTDKVKDVLDDLTDKKIGEKKYQHFRYTDDIGGVAWGNIFDGVAQIVSMKSIPDHISSYGDEAKNYKRRGFFTTLLSELKARGIHQAIIHLQSTDTRNAVSRLIDKGVLINPRNIAGSSGNEHPTMFDIAEADVYEYIDLDETIGTLNNTFYRNRTNIDKFSQALANKLGFSKAEVIDKGSMGYAVDVGNNTIMKVTTDKSEVNESVKLIGKRNKHLGDVYKIFGINNPGYKNVYIILREKLEVNPQYNNQLLEHLIDVLNASHFYLYNFRDSVNDNDMGQLEKIKNTVVPKTVEQAKAFDAFYNVAVELIKNGIRSGDFSQDNFGIKPDGSLAYYDLGYSFNYDNPNVDNVTLENQIFERVMTYMSNSSSVKIKDKCKLNGNGDGTSEPCDQGDINNITVKAMKEEIVLAEAKETKVEYGVAMGMFNIPNWKKVIGVIAKDDIYNKPTFGLEHKPHVTLLYGFHDDVKIDEVIEFLKKHIDEPIEVTIKGISTFETPDYDVVKFDVESEKLHELNGLLRKNFPYTNTYNDYKPHITLSYINKGCAKKYITKFKKSIKLTTNEIVVSDKTKKNKKTLTLQKSKEMISESVIAGIHQLPFKQDIEAMGGKIYSVGGAVRDNFLGKESKDLDLLITGVPLDSLEQILGKYGKVDSVGKSFGIIKFNTPETGELDIAIPRTEKKNDAGGYQGFDVTSDHSLPIEKDLERRDFTINAIAKDAAGNLIDPYGGIEDLKRKQIKMVNPQAFSDDPLRMLRAVQFAARFGFSIEPETLKSIQANAAKIKEISPERILIEFDKIIKKGDPMIGAKLLRQTGLYNQIFNTNHGINLADFKNVETMGEFIYMLARHIQKPSEFFKNNLKGDLDTYAEIKALEYGSRFDGNKKVFFDMTRIYPKSVETKIFGKYFMDNYEYMKAHQMPFSLKDLPVNGNDLMQLGLKGKEIGDTFLKVLNQIYGEKLANKREDILNFIKGGAILNEMHYHLSADHFRTLNDDSIKNAFEKVKNFRYVDDQGKAIYPTTDERYDLLYAAKSLRLNLSKYQALLDQATDDEQGTIHHNMEVIARMANS